MVGLSDGHGSPEDALAPEKRSDAILMIRASPDAEITGGRSSADSSMHACCQWYDRSPHTIAEHGTRVRRGGRGRGRVVQRPESQAA
eukprot:74627-Chlamydomonas_euryale.AAC.7